MDADPDPELLLLYQVAVVCKTFPAYRLDDDIPVEALWALKLLETVEKLQAAG